MEFKSWNQKATTFICLNRQGISCKGYYPRPKMVMNSGKTNCQWEAPSMQSKCLALFPFKFGGGGGGSQGFFFIFPWFPMCSHYCPFKFPTGSQYAPQVPMCSPACSPQHRSLLSHMLWQMVSSFHLYRWAKREELYYFKIEPSILGNLHNFFFC